MTVIVTALAPNAAENSLLVDLARTLDIELIDLRPFELDLAARINVNNHEDVELFTSGQTSRFIRQMGRSDLAARVSELIIDIAASGNVLIASWCAPPVLSSLPHIASIRIDASITHRTSNIQRHLRYPHLDTAALELTNIDSSIERLVRCIFDADWRDAGHFALTVDAERISAQQSIRLIRQFAGDSRFDESPSSHRLITELLETLVRQ